ncbi:hypothetical protein AP1_0466 [Aeromonas phage AP1]|nr:hypothetical protein AP1_0466 [Aeromonas phage AP1]
MNKEVLLEPGRVTEIVPVEHIPDSERFLHLPVIYPVVDTE